MFKRKVKGFTVISQKITFPSNTLFEKTFPREITFPKWTIPDKVSRKVILPERHFPDRIKWDNR